MDKSVDLDQLASANLDKQFLIWVYIFEKKNISTQCAY